jgi:DNA (cytosine-5)-methyltransferase 1
MGGINVDTTEELPTVISFCSGYGGIERGLDLAGLEHTVIAYVEIEAFAIANLVNKMEDGIIPPAPIYTDIKTFPAHLFRDRVDLITGGYPCQPFSAAGKRLGEDDPRHLWPHIRKHIEAIRPARCFFENVEGHISLGLSSVISDLEEDDYRATWGIFSAREVGAPHQRKRVYIMADSGEVSNPRNNRVSIRHVEPSKQGQQRQTSNAYTSCPTLSDTISERLEGHTGHGEDCNQSRWFREKEKRPVGKGSLCNGEPNLWPPEPRVGRVVNGCPDRVDRIRLLGNGVVPQTAAKAYTTLSERLIWHA